MKHLVSVVFCHVSVLCLDSLGPSSDHWAVARLGVARHPCCTRKVHDVNLNKRPRQSVRIFPLRCEVHVRWRWDVQLNRKIHENTGTPKKSPAPELLSKESRILFRFVDLWEPLVPEVPSRWKPPGGSYQSFHRQWTWTKHGQNLAVLHWLLRLLLLTHSFSLSPR